jgi:hypothetical protein
VTDSDALPYCPDHAHACPGESAHPARLVCPDCGRSTPNRDDIAAGYCPWCHWWTSDPQLGPARRAMMAERPSDEEVELLARFQFDRAGPTPTPDLLAKFRHRVDYERLGRRVVELAAGTDTPPEWDQP